MAYMDVEKIIEQAERQAEKLWDKIATLEEQLSTKEDEIATLQQRIAELEEEVKRVNIGREKARAKRNEYEKLLAEKDKQIKIKEALNAAKL